MILDSGHKTIQKRRSNYLKRMVNVSKLGCKNIQKKHDKSMKNVINHYRNG